MYLDVDLPPGIYGNGTGRQARSRWADSSLVRERDGQDLQPVGGWVQRGVSTVTGKARAGVAWKDNSGVAWLGIGTHSKLYVMTHSAALYDITPAGFTAGRADALSAGGYGTGTYGTGIYGTPRPDTTSIQPASVWTLDAFGQYLVGVMADDGKLYQWQLNTGVVAAVIAGAPTGLSGCSVSAERFLFVYAGRRVTWSDQGDQTTWTATATNQAGDLDLFTTGNLLCGRKISGHHLHFTDVDVWRSTYEGLPAVHGFEQVGQDCGIASLGAPVAIDSRCVWMGRKSFYLYNGFVQPIVSEVTDKVFSDFNSQQASKVTSFHNADFGEVWWFYPSAASTENDRYVIWNYKRDHWWIGALSRTFGVSRGVFQYPICADAAGAVWDHENGHVWAGAVPYARTGPFEWPGQLGTGDQRLLIRGFVADEKTVGDSRVTFYGKEYPGGTETAFGPYASVAGRNDCLFTTRQLSMKVEFTQPADSRFGIGRVDVGANSAR